MILVHTIQDHYTGDFFLDCSFTRTFQFLAYSKSGANLGNYYPSTKKTAIKMCYITYFCVFEGKEQACFKHLKIKLLKFVIYNIPYLYG